MRPNTYSLKYFECAAHFLCISLVSSHITNIVKLNQKGNAIVGVISMIIISSTMIVGTSIPWKYPCRVPHKYKFIATVQVMDSWCMAILTSGGVVLRESGDTSLTCGFPFVEGGYEDGRPMEMGA